MTYNITNFDLSNIDTKGSFIVIVGNRCSGKTELVKDMIQNLNCETNLIFSPIDKEVEDYTILLKKNDSNDYNYCFKDIHIGRLESYIDKCKRVREHNDKYNEKAKLYGIPEVYNKNLLVIDTCYDDSLFKSSEFTELIQNTKKHNIYIIMTLQYPMIFEYIKYADYIFMAKDNSLTHRSPIHQKYLDSFPNFESYVNMINAVTLNYNFLVLNNRVELDDEDRFKWYNVKNKTHHLYTSKIQKCDRQKMENKRKILKQIKKTQEETLEKEQKLDETYQIIDS